VLDFNGFNGISNLTSSPGAVFSAGNNDIEGNLNSASAGQALMVDTLH
jgi:hypothetical protein